jgi:hypothetical protein
MTDLVLHPRRYPMHDDPAKGQVFGGECNRTACANQGATWYNIVTYGLYCPCCGPRMNFRDSVIVAPVSAKPTRAQMDDPDWKAILFDRDSR